MKVADPSHRNSLPEERRKETSRGRGSQEIQPPVCYLKPLGLTEVCVEAALKARRIY